ncbi:hypothetical protein [Vibrio maerlii]|uniref:hypothetical protein n=1 Tax=Vibrio maerlii TaxID=2231648 RepID=UPI000E3D84BE|nr:hypothetical protein [Vibrio maerlii]
MSKAKHPLDEQIVSLLQQKGLIKSEAKTQLKRDVYNLRKEEVTQIHNYANHFGIHTKKKIIDEILDIRREAMLSRLLKRT